MKCPIDDTVLQISERSGIEIDWCPTCRGVWLDRGEFDKLIERADGNDRSFRAAREDGRYLDHRDDRSRVAYKPHKKKKGLFGELFEFGD